jgi:hypothetical protein
MSDGGEMASETTNGSPWGIAAFIAKKDGVLGIFLIALCVFIWWDHEGDREDRIAQQAAYKVAFDSLVSAHNRTITVSIQSIEAIKVSTAAVDNTRRALEYVERKHHRNEREN